MNEFDNIGKKLPYRESEAYLDNLINEATENAIMHQNPKISKRSWTMIAVSAAASALLIIGIGTTLLHERNNTTDNVTLSNKGPIDEFLNTLTDEEVMMLPDYEIEEIPEY